MSLPQSAAHQRHVARPWLERVAFRTSRLLDFVGQRELTAQIGHGVEDWPFVVLKEALDNALDAAEEAGVAPVIAITVATDPGSITLTDNGSGIPAATVVDILDYTVRVSSREAYVSPTRGAQGNALKTLLAMPFALDGSIGETRIEAQGIAHTIRFAVDQIRQEPKIDHLTAPSSVKNGTRLTLTWPDSACSILERAKPRFLQIADDFHWLNPHLGLSLEWDGEPEINIEASNPGWQKWLPSEPTSAHWYDPERLTRYMAAHVAHDQDLGRDRTVREFIAEFRGLSGSAKQKRVLDRCNAARISLASFLGNGEASPAVEHLLQVMQQHTRRIKPHDLGVIGQDHLLARFQLAGVDEKTFRYKADIGETPEGLPVVVETAFGWCPAEMHRRRIIAGANWSVALGNPFRDFGRSSEGLEALLNQQRASALEPIVLLVHLASPRVQFSDRGKTALVLVGADS
jgi:DNA topoisomerase VI subunit B